MRRALWLLGMCMQLLMLGCGNGAPRPPALSELAAPHLETFARFDGWARRASLGADAFAQPDAFRETAFSPLREEAQVAGAWISTTGPGARTFELQQGVPLPQVHWARHPRMAYAHLELARAAFSPRPGAALVDCVLVSHNVAEAENTKATATRVTVAFVLE